MEPTPSVPPVRLARRRLPIWIKRASLEAGLIVFSLVLAFLVNEWRQSRAAAERVAEARSLVIEELEFNRDTLRDDLFLKHHESLLTQYRELVRNDGPGDPLFDSGIHPAPLRSSAWRALSSPEVVAGVPYAQTVMLADIYQEQERLEQMHWTAISWLSAPQPAAATAEYQRARRQAIALYLADVVSTERRLIARYAKALEVLAAPPPDS